MYEISKEAEAQQKLREMGVDISEDPRPYVEILSHLEALALSRSAEIVAVGVESDAWRID